MYASLGPGARCKGPALQTFAVRVFTAAPAQPRSPLRRDGSRRFLRYQAGRVLWLRLAPSPKPVVKAYRSHILAATRMARVLGLPLGLCLGSMINGPAGSGFSLKGLLVKRIQVDSEVECCCSAGCVLLEQCTGSALSLQRGRSCQCLSQPHLILHIENDHDGAYYN